MRLALLFLAPLLAAADIRIGIIGTDTSHVPAFTKVLNDANAPNHIPGARIVAAYKGGSKSFAPSYERVDRFAQEIHDKYGVEIVPTIDELLQRVDAVLVESVDGRQHLEQLKPVLAARKPVFIDKPLATTLADAKEIARLAAQHGTPWFSTSSLRFSPMTQQVKYPDVTGALVWGPGPEPEGHQLDLSYYGIHPVETLYTLLGPGCETVTRTVGADSDTITCRWKDGRLGTVKTLRPKGDYGAVVFRPSGIERTPPRSEVGYDNLVKEIVKFFQTKQPPVSNAETLEIFAFLDAAQRSKANGGQPVKLQP